MKASIVPTHDPPREQSEHWRSGAIGNSKTRKIAEMIMSTISSARATARSTKGQPWASGLAATLKRWWAAYITWRVQQAATAQLWSMSDRELKDIGLTRYEITTAVKGDPTRNRKFSRYY